MTKEYLDQTNQEKFFDANRQQEIEIFAKTLCNFVTKIDLFGTDKTDEFVVTRENGLNQGIFKTWAVPVIPFLETDTTTELSKSLLVYDKFSDRLTPKAKIVLNDWSMEMKTKPIKLWQSLEKWRNFSDIFDRRLQIVFSEKKLPESKEDRVAELYLQLITAFAFGSPFYNLEAMVGDTQETKFNPVVNTTNSQDNSGGGLDLVAMALPSALKNKVLAKKLNWSGLNWEKIHDLSAVDVGDPEFVLAFRIAKTIGVDIDDVVFAANALQWIPVNVAGKIDDLKEKDAQSLITSALKPSKFTSTEAVGRNVNALIRFFNWFPLIKSVENFGGKNWRYSAVCDTSDALLAEVNTGGILKPEFETIFSSGLAGQLKHLDATSAKGRFLIQLLNEGKVSPSVIRKIREREQSFFQDVSQKLTIMEKEEAIIDINTAKPRSLVGGKAAGLREAALVFGVENVIPGVVITTEAVENWLKQSPNIWNAIIKFNSLKSIDEKVALSKLISKNISEREFSTNLDAGSEQKLAIRSSSFDEDTDFNGTAAGIYDSIVNINASQLDTAIPKVISSFFSEKAVSYRHLQGLSDFPMFAVIVSPFIEGRGGAAFSAGNGGDWEIVVAEKPAYVVGNSTSAFDSYKKHDGIVSVNATNSWVDTRTIDKIGAMLNKAEKVIGERIDLEFAIDKNEKVWVLQMRSIRTLSEKKTKKDFSHLKTININSIDELQNTNGKLNRDTKLIIGKKINIDQFQGSLFRWLTINRDRIKQISLSQRIPRTSHFANICINLGIDLIFENEYKTD